MNLKEIGKTLQNIVKENIDIVNDMWESVPSDMKKKIQDEIEKVKQQYLEYQEDKKEEQQN